MIYSVHINRPSNNVRIYSIKKSVSGNTNAFSRKVDSMIKRYLLKKADIK
ncbi:MAG: hypothetical protein ACYCO0_01495 [Candidatus Micrarchaeaceae archaeon]